MSSAIDFILIFVSLELVTISFYVLVPFMRRNAASLEAGVKYLILSALATGFTVYGITWIYGVTRQTNLTQIRDILPSIPLDNQPGLLFGGLLVLVGLGFKIAAAPFQFWVPDVYQGAATPVTAFLAFAPKAAGMVAIISVLSFIDFNYTTVAGHAIMTLLEVMAVLSMTVGNVLALLQRNLKRMFAYSSIEHMGIITFAFGMVNPPLPLGVTPLSQLRLLV